MFKEKPITEEEYKEFLAYMYEYQRSKEEKKDKWHESTLYSIYQWLNHKAK